MADRTKIEWCDATWNPIVGCSRVSPGCDHCWAIRNAWRLASNPHPWVRDAFGGLVKCGLGQRLDWTGTVRCLPERLAQPLRWRKPRGIFVCGMSDLFHSHVPDEFIAAVFAVMAACPQHTFVVLTKRPERMAHLLSGAWSIADLDWFTRTFPLRDRPSQAWPLPNIWLGVTVESQEQADRRIPLLLQVPAAVRWLSVEPMLGPIDLTKALSLPPMCPDCGGVRRWDWPAGGCLDSLCVSCGRRGANEDVHVRPDYLNWVVCGGETGPDARPMDETWARSLKEQCSSAGVAFFMKQMARKAPIPSDLMIWDFPELPYRRFL